VRWWCTCDDGLRQPIQHDAVLGARGHDVLQRDVSELGRGGGVGRRNAGVVVERQEDAQAHIILRLCEGQQWGIAALVAGPSGVSTTHHGDATERHVLAPCAWGARRRGRGGADGMRTGAPANLPHLHHATAAPHALHVWPRFAA